MCKKESAPKEIWKNAILQENNEKAKVEFFDYEIIIEKKVP